MHVFHDLCTYCTVSPYNINHVPFMLPVGITATDTRSNGTRVPTTSSPCLNVGSMRTLSMTPKVTVCLTAHYLLTESTFAYIAFVTCLDAL